MDGFLAEYGPMRFENMAQPLLMKLIDDLGLETCHFPPYTPATDPKSLFNLWKDENHLQGQNHNQGIFNTLELLALGILRILQKSGGDFKNPEDKRHWDWWAGLDETFYRQVRNEFTFNGKPLYETGFWNVLTEVLSHKAVQKIINYGTFYHVIHNNPGAAEWIIFWLRGLHPRDRLVGIKQGTEALITQLVNKLSTGPDQASLFLNHRLTTIHQKDDDRICLKFISNNGEKTEVLTRRLILAIPQNPLKQLSPFLPENITRLLHTVIPIPLLKCFFVTSNPWWNEKTKPQTRASSVPARELHYYYRQEGKEKRGMVMVYGDKPSMNYWTTFVKNTPHLKAELNQDRRLIDYYMKYLSNNPGRDDPKEHEKQLKAITSFGIRDWSVEPFEAGCHIWKPGVKVEQAIDQLTSFSLPGSPSGAKNVHICGEAYSDFQGFIEGALRTAEKVVKEIN